MATRVFALIIGIDSYKAGAIWNLNSCVDDAQNMRRWLTEDLSVPRDQIRLLLDSDASKQRIEDTFMDHLVNNPAIERGDAIIIYFAGHGSTLPAPNDWYQGESPPTTVPVLCTYDHDTERPGQGIIAGISDRSMHAMINDLSKLKGDNITFILDCCFNPLAYHSSIRHRSHTRWTPTTEATSAQLYHGLWSSARGRPQTSHTGFYPLRPSTHTLLAACGPAGKAGEGKEGGRFTSALLHITSEMPIHRTTYVQFIEHVAQQLSSQQAICLGKNKNRVLFNGVPFIPDARFLPVAVDKERRLRVEVGAIQGITTGSEMTIHMHNYRCSRNTSIASVVVSEVHPTWSFVRSRSQESEIPASCWAQVTKWNNRRPFRVKLKSTFTSFLRMWKLRRFIPKKADEGHMKTCLNVLRVTRSQEADISVTVGRSGVVVKRYDDALDSHQVVTIEKKTGLEVVDDAARFHLHLHRRNPEYPLRNLIHMELFYLNRQSWIKSRRNLLEDGKATIHYDQHAVYSMMIHNQSDLDLWPYLAYMDPNSYAITILYHPEPSLGKAPLPKGGQLEIGSGKTGSEALSFTLRDDDYFDTRFLKLFLSTSPVKMDMIEQGPSVKREGHSYPISLPLDTKDQIWDTEMACITFIRRRSTL
ncbi:hypothetical protein BDQ12DRAFT_11332 [Crucibulum laeve]|uniref:Peptidase C14 caspase domain-containing protein n=1 Tax=Crucibulum laeve TaxID=68775 RepID=A0A5C3MIZ4_9AGAR|nr:hypothetical protein BDQ12DRAFT_11332 [Crucibulum laeve]